MTAGRCVPLLLLAMSCAAAPSSAEYPVHVELFAARDGVRLRAVTTPDGRFDFPGVAPGRYCVRATAESLSPMTRHVVLTRAAPRRPIRFDMKLNL
jgi:Carboxypeptidase regulatory-like domain